jgi:hypothetical protein
MYSQETLLFSYSIFLSFSAHFESELTHLRKENLDYSRRLSQAREQVQGQKKDPRGKDTDPMTTVVIFFLAQLMWCVHLLKHNEVTNG